MSKPSLYILVLAALLSLVLSGCKEETREDLMAQGAKYMGEGNPKGAAVIFKSILEKNPNDMDARLELAKAYLEAGKPDQAEKEAERLAALPNAPDRIQLLLGKSRLAQGKAREAKADLEAFLMAVPESAEGWEYLGHTQVLMKDLAAAEDDYKRSLKLNPDRTKAKLGLVEAEMGLSKLDEANATLDEFMAKNPNNQPAMHLKAKIQLRQNDKQGAIATYEAIAAKFPNDVAAKYLEAHLILETKGVTPEVEKTAESLMKDFPKQPEGFKLKGLVDYQKGDFAQAIPRFQQALRLRQELETDYFLALAFDRAGDVESAISSLRIVLDNAPRFVNAWRLMASLNLRANRPEEAVNELNKALEVAPDDPVSLRMLGDIYMGKKNMDKSLELFNEIPDNSSQAGVAHLRKGVILAAKGDQVDAEKELRKSVEISGDKIEPRVYLATFLARQKKLDEGLAVLDVPNTSPQYQALALNAQAMLLLQAGGHQDEAMAKLEKAKSLDPGLVVTYQTLARVYMQSKEPEKAVEQYQKVLERKPQDLEANTGLAVLKNKSGDYKDAQQYFQKAAESKQLPAFINLAEFYIQRKMNDDALKTLDQAIALNKNATQALVLKVRLLATMGDPLKTKAAIQDLEAVDKYTALSERLKIETAAKNWPEAEKVASGFIDLNPTSAESYMPLVTLKESQGDIAGAASVMQRAIQADNSSIKARIEFANLLIKMRKYQDAITYLNQVTSSYPSLAMGYALRGLAKENSGDKDGAISDYEQALSYQSTIPMALNNLAMLYAERPAKTLRAVDLAKAALALDQNNPSIMDTLGYAMLKNGQMSEAKDVLQRAASLAPSDENIAKHLKLASSSPQ